MNTGPKYTSDTNASLAFNRRSLLTYLQRYILQNERKNTSKKMSIRNVFAIFLQHNSLQYHANFLSTRGRMQALK